MQAALLACACIANAHAWDDRIRTRAVLDDPSATLRIDDVQHADFTPLSDELLVRGYTDSASWLRIVVAATEAGEPLKLRIRPTFVDEVQLFEPDPQQAGHWLQRRTGDRTPFEASDRSLNALGFIIRPHAPETTYYLRLKTTSTSILYVQALTLPQAEFRDSMLVILQLAYLCLVGWATLWAIGSFLRERNAVPGWFAIFQVSNIFYALCIMGFMAPLEPSQWPGLMDRLTSWSAITTTFLGLVFHRSVMLLYHPARFWRWLLNLLLPTMGAILIMYTTGHQRLALQINLTLLPFLSLLFASISFAVDGANPLLPGVRLLRTIYVASFGSILLTVVPLLGQTHAAEWALQANLIHGLIASGLMVYWLSRKFRLNRQRLDAERAQLSRMQYQLEAEKKQADEQQQFIDMLTHEIKTPLSVALMSVGALKFDHPYIDRIQQALRNIDGIVDRTRLSDLAEHQGLTPRHAVLDLGDLVADCCAASTQPERLKVLVGQPVTLVSDSQLLGIVLANLIDNALKYAAPSSTVTVEIEAASLAATEVMLRVRNALGPAGAPDPARVFDKYYRSAQAQSKSGSGLGLYLSRNIAYLLGGRLAHAVQDDEVVFTLWLPV